MKHGIACSFVAPRGTRLADAVTAAANAATAAGLSSWWATGDREQVGDRAFDATLGLQCVARASAGLRICGSGDILSVHGPAVRAKQLATLDWFSGGRVELGLDLLTPPAELTEDDDADPIGRGLDHFGAMRAFWTQRRATYESDTLRFAGAIALPKPQGDRVPRTHVRSAPAATLRRYTERFGAPDGWLAWLLDADELVAAAAELNAATGADAEAVRRTWCVPAADLADAREAIASTGQRIDELVAVFDHVPTPAEIAAVAA